MFRVFVFSCVFLPPAVGRGPVLLHVRMQGGSLLPTVVEMSLGYELLSASAVRVTG